MSDGIPAGALVAPAVARNREPILAAWRAHLPQAGRVLEIASGSGEHALFLASAMPDLDWQPSDRDDAALASIAAWRDATGPANLRAPIRLDAAVRPWPVDGPFDIVLSINMIHIAPFAACEGLIAEAAHLLAPGGALVLYGPFNRNGRFTAPSNETFDASLRARNPEWGIRDLEEVAALAAASGFGAPEVVEMPANNLVVVFGRAG